MNYVRVLYVFDSHHYLTIHQQLKVIKCIQMKSRQRNLHRLLIEQTKTLSKFLVFI